ncbi:MAG TPA: hypothetical protein VIT68_00930 [Candidatus Gracilibacteria bacterium]
MSYSKIRLWSLSIALVFGSFLFSAHAADLGTPVVNRSGSQLVISWPAYTGTEDFEGYALQWDDNVYPLKINEYARQYLGKANSLSIRGVDFLRREDYYFRVYLWKTNNSGRKVLIKGSQILHWRENADFTIITLTVAPNDPLIVNNDSDSSSDTVVNTDLYNLPNLSKNAYDTFVRFAWSRPNLASNEFDGTKIELSDSSDFANILITLEADEDDIQGEITGLSPGTTYYARGSYHKNDILLGTPATRTFTTIAAVPRDGRSVASRNIQKIEKKKMLPSVSLGGESTTTTTTSTSTSTSTTGSTSTTTASTFDTSTTSAIAINRRITELESLIKQYQSEIRTLKAKLPRTSTSSTTTSRTTSTSSSRINLSSIRAILEQRRNAR